MDLRQLRLSQSLNFDQMGSACGYTKISWYNWETGRHNPTLHAIRAICARFNVTATIRPDQSIDFKRSK